MAAHPRLIGIFSGRSRADPFVVALAMVHGGTVVTEESASPNLTVVVSRGGLGSFPWRLFL